MGSISSEERLEPYLKCHFPTSPMRGIQGQEYGLASVDIAPSQTLHHLKPEERIARYQSAWALLLRAYTNHDHVSFLKVCGASEDSVHPQPSLLLQSPCSSVFRFCQYEVGLYYKVRHVKPLFELNVVEVDKVEHRVNTAIIFMWEGRNPSEDEAVAILQGGAPALDMYFEVLVEGPSPRANIRYRRGKVSDAYAERVVLTLQNALYAIENQRSLPLHDVSILTSLDIQCMRHWNPSDLRSHSNDCMHHLLEAKVSQMPNAEAVCAWDGTLSYKELDSLASSAARMMASAGVHPGSYVIFAFQKSLWAVIAAYGILKAGGAFVPVDPTHPISWLREIFRNTQARFLVTSDLHAPTFEAEDLAVITVSKTSLDQDAEQAKTTVIGINVKPTDPIFVLFTSGSTGKPKGMVLQHGAICTHALCHGEEMSYHGKRVLQFAAHTFDVAIMDFFTTLLYGGVICIPSEEERRNDVVGAINRFRADFALLTPSFAGLIDPADVPTLKHLAIGGEALSQDRVRRWAQKTSLIQVYGPAEAGICVLRYMSREETMPENIGYAMPNSSCWLVHPDDASRLVPIGAVGEMLIAGPSLALGYLNDDIKTKASFVGDLPWAKAAGLAGARFYKSGDLLRYNTTLCDGSFDFVGRKDTQIKLRGQRMELGELEHFIASIPVVAVSMVTRPDRGCFAGELLVILQVRDSQSSRIRHDTLEIALEQGVTIGQIRAHLEPFLPAYMLPTAALTVKSMPFVPSLKVNRKMVETWLANMTEKPHHLAAATLARIGTSPLRPEETTARTIATEVARLLIEVGSGDHEKLHGVDFNLQKSGLDSIRSMSLAMFIQRKFGIKLPLWALLSSKVTVRHIAALVDERQASKVIDELRSIDLLAEADTLSKEVLASFSPAVTTTQLWNQSKRRNVFLTGASGYLGSALLKQLLGQPHVTVFALLRCSNEAQGLQQLTESAKQQGDWWHEGLRSRLRIWRGDFVAPRLGLAESQLQALQGSTIYDPSQHIHSIVHNGARVHYSTDYSTLKAANVDSTVELLRIAAGSSSVSNFVFVSGGRSPDDQDDEARDLAMKLGNDTGYAQSKFVAEQIVRNVTASDEGPFSAKQVGIIRPGYIVGSLEARQGDLKLAPNQRDYLWRLVAGCIEVGSYSADESSQWLCVADVETVASATVAMISKRPSNRCLGLKIDSIRDGLPPEELWNIVQSYGYHLEPLPHAQWRKQMRAVIEEKGERHPLFPLLHMLDRDLPKGKLASIPSYSEEKLEATKRLMRRNIEHLIATGFLPAPSAEAVPKSGCLAEQRFITRSS